MKITCDFQAVHNFTQKIRNYEKFEETMVEVTRELAEIFHKILKSRTPVETGELKAGWDGENLKFAVEKVKDGYEVTFTNKVEYAWWVNYGHMSYNQFGGPYLVKNRVKVPTPKQWQKDASDFFVYGHFFVEQSVLDMEQKNLDDILYEKLKKWFEWCCG